MHHAVHLPTQSEVIIKITDKLSVETAKAKLAESRLISLAVRSKATENLLLSEETLA